MNLGMTSHGVGIVTLEASSDEQSKVSWHQVQSFVGNDSQRSADLPMV